MLTHGGRRVDVRWAKRGLWRRERAEAQKACRTAMDVVLGRSVQKMAHQCAKNSTLVKAKPGVVLGRNEAVGAVKYVKNSTLGLAGAWRGLKGPKPAEAPW